eukprot:gene7755-7207_t
MVWGAWAAAAVAAITIDKERSIGRYRTCYDTDVAAPAGDGGQQQQQQQQQQQHLKWQPPPHDMLLATLRVALRMALPLTSRTWSAHQDVHLVTGDLKGALQ